jgi:hypothetical protein
VTGDVGCVLREADVRGREGEVWWGLGGWGGGGGVDAFEGDGACVARINV